MEEIRKYEKQQPKFTVGDVVNSRFNDDPSLLYVVKEGFESTVPRASKYMYKISLISSQDIDLLVEEDQLIFKFHDANQAYLLNKYKGSYSFERKKNMYLVVPSSGDAYEIKDDVESLKSIFPNVNIIALIFTSNPEYFPMKCDVIDKSESPKFKEGDKVIVTDGWKIGGEFTIIEEYPLIRRYRCTSRYGNDYVMDEDMLRLSSDSEQ